MSGEMVYFLYINLFLIISCRSDPLTDFHVQQLKNCTIMQGYSFSGLKLLKFRISQFTPKTPKFYTKIDNISENGLFSWKCTEKSTIKFVILIRKCGSRHQFISHTNFGLHTSVLSHFLKENWESYLYWANSNFTECQSSITEQQSVQWWEATCGGPRNFDNFFAGSSKILQTGTQYLYVHRVPKKESHLMFDNNLANVDRFSKFFHQLICKKILYVYTQRLPSHLQYVATLPCETQKSKNVTDFDSTSSE